LLKLSQLNFGSRKISYFFIYKIFFFQEIFKNPTKIHTHTHTHL
jgi:hypothetical protein